MSSVSPEAVTAGSMLALMAPEHTWKELRKVMVGVPGLEPGTSTSRTWRPTDWATPRISMPGRLVRHPNLAGYRLGTGAMRATHMPAL